MKLPTLFKKTSTGAIQQWDIEVRGATIITRHGQRGGKIQETRDTVKEGKNAGRANATTAAEQAVLEAKAKHLKQRKKGYHESAEAAAEGRTDAAIEGGMLPMLAVTYEKGADRLKFPCYVQPKFDGHRCLAERTQDAAALWTRSRKRILCVPHIERAIASLGGSALYTPWSDGELYNHDFRNNFQQLTSLLRSKEPAPGHEVVQLHVYDLPGEGTYAERYAKLKAISPAFKGTPLRLVETILVNDEDELWAAHRRFVAQGYEGAIARNADGLYENKRSFNLVKLKDFIDAEFEIIGLEEGRGKLAGHCGAFVCRLDAERSFNAKMVGPTANLKEAWENPKAWTGRQVTVRFMRYTSDGVPFHPRVLRPREDL